MWVQEKPQVNWAGADKKRKEMNRNKRQKISGDKKAGFGQRLNFAWLYWGKFEVPIR